MKTLQYVCFSCLFYLLLLSCSGEGSNSAFSDSPVIRPKLTLVYPEKTENVDINSSIVIKCNKPINTEAFDESMMTVGSEHGTLAGSVTVLDDTIVFLPQNDVLMDGETKYTVKVSNIIDIEGFTIDSAFERCFTTGIDKDLLRPYPELIKAIGNTVTVYFNEPLLSLYLQDDAITVYNITEENFLTGSLHHATYSNEIIFFSEETLSVDNKFRVIVNGNKGITDLANNEFIENCFSWDIFPEPAEDNEPPYITCVYTDVESKSFTIYFSEIIDSFNLYEHDSEHIIYSLGVQVRHSVGPLGVNTKLIDGHNGLKVEINGLNDSTNTIFNGLPLTVYVTKSAVIDLKGNGLITNNNQVYIDDGKRIYFTWIVPQ